LIRSRVVQAARFPAACTTRSFAIRIRLFRLAEQRCLGWQMSRWRRDQQRIICSRWPAAAIPGLKRGWAPGLGTACPTRVCC